MEVIRLRLGRCKPVFDGAVVRLPCVNRDWAWQAGGLAMSAMPRKRRLAVEMSHVAMGQKATSEEDRRAEPALTGYRRSSSPGYATALPQDFGGGKSSAIG